MTPLNPSVEWSGTSLFHDLPTAQLACVQTKLRRRNFARDSAILLAEQQGNTVYFLAEGLAKVVTLGSGNAPTLLELLGPGEIIGEIHALDGLGHSADVIAALPSVCWWLSHEDFHACLASMPQLALNVLRLTARRLRHSTEKVAMLSTQDTPGRIARQLLILAAQCGVPTPEGGTLIPIPLTQTDFASLTGCCRQSANEALGFFRKRGDISFSPARHIILHRPQSLLQRSI